MWEQKVLAPLLAGEACRPFSSDTHHTMRQNRQHLDTSPARNSCLAPWPTYESGLDVLTTWRRVFLSKFPPYLRLVVHTVLPRLGLTSKANRLESSTPNVRARHFSRTARGWGRLRTV
jgi:hypothetical protein